MTVISRSRVPRILTNHAKERMAEMGLNGRQLLEIMDEPALTYPCYANKTAEQNGIAVIYAEKPDRDVVITVIYSRPEQYMPRKEELQHQ